MATKQVEKILPLLAIIVVSLTSTTLIDIGLGADRVVIQVGAFFMMFSGFLMIGFIIHEVVKFGIKTESHQTPPEE